MPVSNRERSRSAALASRAVLSEAGYPCAPHTEPYSVVVGTDTGSLLVKCTYNPAIDQYVVDARFANRTVAAQERKRQYGAKLDHRAETAEAATRLLLKALRSAGHRPKGTTPTVTPSPAQTPAEALAEVLNANHGRVKVLTEDHRHGTHMTVLACKSDARGLYVADVTEEVADVLGLDDGRSAGQLFLPGKGFVPTWELLRRLNERLNLSVPVSAL